MASNSDKIPYMRVRDIALESHTSAASVMRFVHKIGYESFTEFKAHFSSSSMQSTELLRGFQVLSKERFPSDIDTKLRIIAEKMQQCENIIFLEWALLVLSVNTLLEGFLPLVAIALRLSIRPTLF